VFTGIVEAVGRVESVRRTRIGASVSIAAPFARHLARGESVAVSGVCLTVVRADSRRFCADAVAHTLDTTCMGRVAAGARVNLERAVEVGERLGGHLVSGHVDGVATVTAIRPEGRGREIVFELPEGLARHVAERGSIAVDGVSLTVARVEGNLVTVSLIPETLEATIAGGYRAGTRVNVETDLLAKYQESSASQSGATEAKRKGITMERLRELGYLKEQR
jgi:riboflavin synthase